MTEKQVYELRVEKLEMRAAPRPTVDCRLVDSVGCRFRWVCEPGDSLGVLIDALGKRGRVRFFGRVVETRVDGLFLTDVESVELV